MEIAGKEVATQLDELAAAIVDRCERDLEALDGLTNDESKLVEERGQAPRLGVYRHRLLSELRPESDKPAVHAPTYTEFGSLVKGGQ